MKKVIFFIVAISFGVAVNATDVQVNESVWQKTKDKCTNAYNKVSSRIKNSEYTKPALIGTAAVVGVAGASFGGYKTYKKIKTPKV
ncbi:MAG: hypothetical protein ABIF12_03620 [bacterium]